MHYFKYSTTYTTVQQIAFVVLFPILYMLEKHVSFFSQLSEIWMLKAVLLSVMTAIEL